MSRKLVSILAVLFLTAYGGYIFFFAPILQERSAVRDLEYQDVDLSQVPDGDFYGEFGYGSHLYAVEVSVRAGRIVAIDVVNNRTSEHAIKAEEVTEKVLQAQSVNVDAVSGATTTSKAILKAIENALLTAGEAGGQSKPHITGLIYKAEGGRILVVEGIESADTDSDTWFNSGYPAIWLTLSAETVIVGQDGGEAGAFSLAVGKTVEAWVDGPVLESYPEQGGARKIVIID